MSETGTPLLSETIQLNVNVPAENSLKGLLTQLDQVKAKIIEANEALAGITKKGGKAVQPPWDVEKLKRDMQELQKGIGGPPLTLNLADLAKAYNLELTQLRAFLRQRKDILRQEHYQARQETFGSVPSAATHIVAFQQEQWKNRPPTLKEVLLTPTVASVHGSGTVKVEGLTATVEGAVPLKVPGAQLQASVEGAVKLVIPAAQVVAAAEGAATRDPATGRFLPGSGASGGAGKSGGGGRGKKKKDFGPLDVPDQPGEFARRRVEAGDRIRETVSRRDASGAVVHETWDNAEQAVRAAKTVTETVTGLSPLQQFREARRSEARLYRREVAKLSEENDVMYDVGLARAMRRQAKGLEGLITNTPGFAEALGPVQARTLQTTLNQEAATLREQARGTVRESVRRERERRAKAAERQDQEEIRNQEKALNRSGQSAAAGIALTRTEQEIWRKTHPDIFRSGAGQTHFFSEMARASDEAADKLEKSLAINAKAGARVREHWEEQVKQHRANAELFRVTANGGAPGEPKLSGNAARLQAGLESGFTPMGFAANLTKVAGWAAAVGVLYKSIEAARYSMEKFIEVGEMTARLDLVFRKVGGSAEELTGDILKLAAANARDTAEAMESATEWARLGLTRKEVGEVTAVSMQAANVAHMKVSETTKQLATLMHVYNLEAGELSGVLGMLTATSQRYNVTLEDLFLGLDRSAATARQAKMGLGELQALIAVMVGRTGQTGIIVGNTIKNLITQFSNPTFQQYLRARGIETMVTEGPNAGQLKSSSQIMRDVFVRYQGMTEREQTDFARQWGGKLQVGRTQALMEGYVDAQKLAVDTQLQLNAAQQANARILGTLKAQLSALRVEWDRLAMIAGQKWGPAAGEYVRMAKNWLRSANGSWQEPAAGTPAHGLPGYFGMKMPKGWQDAEAYRKWFANWLAEQAKKSGREMGVWEAVWKSGTTLPPFHTDVRQMPLVAYQEAQKRKYESPYERGEQEFQNKVQELQGKAAASALRARLFETVSAALPLAKPEMAASIAAAAASEMSYKDAQAFRAMQVAGDQAGMHSLLLEQAHRAQQESVGAASAEATERTRRIAEGRAALAVVDEQIQKAQAEGRDTTALVERKGELTRAIDANSAARAQNLAYMEDEIGKTEQAIWVKQQYVDLLKQQEMVMQGLQQLAAQGNPDTMGVRLDSTVGALRDEVAMLEAEKARLEQHEMDVGTPEATQAKEAVQKELVEKRAQLAAQDSPQMRQLAATYDARKIAEERAHLEAGSYAVGFTESGKLLAEEAGVSRELARLRQRRDGVGVTDNEAARGKQLEVELMHTQEQIQTRIVDLARQERQIRMDAMREFNKGLLLAGPGELLQRLQATQMLHRNVGPGEFFATSPEVRRMYFEARGGDAGMMNRWEQRELHRAGWARPRTVAEEQAAQGMWRGQIERWNTVLRRDTMGALSTHPDMPLSDLNKGAKAVTDSLLVMQGGVLTVTDALARLSKVVQDFYLMHPSGGGAARPSGPKYNTDAGFAPGAFQGHGAGGSWGAGAGGEW